VYHAFPRVVVKSRLNHRVTNYCYCKYSYNDKHLSFRAIIGKKLRQIVIHMARTKLNTPFQGIPFTRAGSIRPFERFLHEIGAPFERFLNMARIPADLLEEPDQPIPLFPAYKFTDIAARSEGIEGFGLEVAGYARLEDFGTYGQKLLQATTVYDYLNTGIRLLNTLTVGEKFWMEPHDGYVRFCHSTASGNPEESKTISLFSLGVTMNTLRAVCGINWAPEHIGLQSTLTRKPDMDFLADTQFIQSAGYSYFTFPRRFLGLPFRSPDTVNENSATTQEQAPQMLEEEFTSSVRHFVQMMLPYRYTSIDDVADAANLSKRTFQRELTESQTTYSALVEDVRIRMACNGLEQTDMPVTEISKALAYNDASNFTRAFKRRTGVAPATYRNNFKP